MNELGVKKMGEYQKIDTVYLRKMKKNSTAPLKDGIYPLYSNSTIAESYNFANIRDSVSQWNRYSDSVSNNWKQMMRLFHTVAEAGNQKELDTITSIIKENVNSNIECPAMMKKDILNRYSNSESDMERSYLYSIRESIDQTIEADRVLKNFGTLSKRFNISKLINENILFEDAFEETMYSLCSLVDTYQMDYKSKYCIASEAALYAIYESVDDCDIGADEYLRSKLNNKAILESVLDYFLVNYSHGYADKNEFINIMEETAHKDPFIANQIDSYFDLLREATKDLSNETISRLDNPLYENDIRISDNISQYELIQEMTEELTRLTQVHEMTLDELASKAKETMAKIKMLPSQATSQIKLLIYAILVPCRAEDMAKGVHNILSDIFYAAITIGALSVGGPLLGIFTAIAALITRKCVQKEYLKASIQEWREHKYSVKRKLDDCKDPDRRKLIEAYLDKLDATLEDLEKAYEEMRDKTTDELKDSSNRRLASPDYHKINADTVNPNGKITPSSFVYDKSGNDSTMVKLGNDLINKRTAKNDDDDDDFMDGE